jgi:antitoxin VapB
VETAKVFTNGKSQAVRLPKSCRFSCDEVVAKKIGDIVILCPQDKALENFLRSEPIDDDVFASIDKARREAAAYEASHTYVRERLQ